MLAIDWDKPWLRWGAFLGFAVIFIYRGFDAFANPQFWAEDVHFFTQARDLGLESLITLYNGYQHALPRIIIWLANQVPLRWATIVMNYGALLVTLLSVALLAHSSVRLPAKPLLFLVLAILPHTGEIYGNITNLQWYFFWALLGGAFLVRLEHSAGFYFVGTCLLLAAFSTPMIIILLPLYWLRLFLSFNAEQPWCSTRQLAFSGKQARLSQRRFLQLTTILTLIGLYQGLMVVLHPMDFGPLELRPFHLKTALAISTDRTLQPLLFDQHLFMTASNHWLSFLIFACTILFALFQAYRIPQIAIYIFGIIGVSLLFHVMVLFKHAQLLHLMTPYQNADRYYFPLRILFIWLLVISLNRDSLRALIMAFLFVATAFSMYSFQRPPLKDLNWPKQVEQIEAQLARGELAWFPTNPPPWSGHFEPKEKPIDKQAQQSKK